MSMRIRKGRTVLVPEEGAVEAEENTTETSAE
jgi:hypothetical protein